MCKKVIIAVILCLFVAASVSAQQRGTPAEAKKMVEDAIAYIKANGKNKAFAEISNPKGKFVDRDLYVYVCDMNGTCLARGDDPSSVREKQHKFERSRWKVLYQGTNRDGQDPGIGLAGLQVPRSHK